MLVITDYPENLDQVRKILKEVDRRPQQILVEATILRAALTEDNALGVDFNIIGGADFSTIISNAAGQITNAGAGSFSTNASSVGTGNAFSNNINGGLKVGVVTNNVSVFVAALEGVTDTTVLANPKVLALNKQKGEVIVGRKDGYLTTTVTESAQTQTVEFLDTGTRLIFRPFIGDDGYIRMEIHPEDSRGGLTSANLPFKETTEVTSNVMVKDGHTIVIGGLFREASDSSRSQIPVLGNLPFAGVLFRQQRDRTQREEVIILLTPHIVQDDAAYSAVSEEQLKMAEKMRVGIRRGMMFWGRERLAEWNYECAVKEMTKSNPDRNKAIWFLDAATGLNPMFIEAINMRQDLTGQELTMTGGSTARSFVQRAILADRAPATMPSADADDLMCDPSTQPAMTEVPSSQPALADALSSMSPTGMPGHEMVVVDVDSFQTSPTQPAMVDATTQPVHSATAEGLGLGNIFAMMNRMLGLEQTGTMKTGDENAMEMTVTELPLEEVPQESSGNK
jgi:type IV pilus assembly protein PilQ